jgi:poly-beta-hydroxybutyrate-responsive repressor
LKKDHLRANKELPVACAMGNIYRFVEPVILLMLRDKGQSYGYDLAGDLKTYALTDSEIEGAALYRTLRRLEANGFVTSEWETNTSGPARRVYLLTKDGERHLAEWAEVLDQLGRAMGRFARSARNNKQRPRSSATVKRSRKTATSRS